MATRTKATRAKAAKAAVEAIRAVEAEAVPIAQEAPAVPAILRTTPSLPNGKGPDPEAIREGRFAPKREGYVLSAVLSGNGEGTFDGILNYLVANPPSDYKGKIRKPTVDYFLRAAAVAGIVETVKVAGRTVYLPLADSPFAFAKATAEGLAFRNRVLGFLAPAAPVEQEKATEDGAAATRKGNRKARRAEKAKSR